MAHNLQGTMKKLIDLFHSYSGKVGDKYHLNKTELKSLLQEELSGLLCDSRDRMAVEKIFSELDTNKDGEVNFPEFVALVTELIIACDKFFIGFKKDEMENSNPKKD
ncbi:protein S100-A1-like [Xiphias gladius]|uniref:protein S100-A1-like n=1 Tax=Xiphias gladius TaxID=8245 RepID=UPI001A9821CB|nr:protein S100-A1-like [Xiphias gladius]